MAIEIKPQKHLINILKSTRNPNFTLFLGAGASVTSGVRNAAGLIEQWRNTFEDMYPGKEIASQHWHNTPTEYSELFELLYDQPSQRREFIEKCVENALPSWGYIYLANLLKRNIFNTIFTTNFDDLINEACYSFSTDLKPLVSAHDSSISSVRLTSPRPKIIKLHGDFLFDNIKNTVRELESLEDNMRSKFKQYASEFGMIVIGYSGNDRSIMETLNTLLRYDNNFPHGIYWCVRKGTIIDELSKDLEELTRFPRFHLIEIDGFDECLADIHNDMNLDLQDEVSNPYRHLANRLDNFVKRNGADDGDEHEHIVINSDINKLKDNIQQIQTASELVEKFEKIFSEVEGDANQKYDALNQLAQEMKAITSKLTGEIHIVATPNALLAEFEYNDENYSKALSLSEKALEARLTIEAIVILIKSLNKLDKMNEFSSAMQRLYSFKSIQEKEGHRINSAAVDLIDAEHYEEASELLQYIQSKKLPEDVNSFVRLNQALVFKLQGKELTEAITTILQEDLNDAIQKDNYWLSFGLSLILNKDESALEHAKLLTEGEIRTIIQKEQPIMNLISDNLYEKLLQLKIVLDIAEEDVDDVYSSDIEALLEEDTVADVEPLLEEKAVANSDIPTTRQHIENVDNKTDTNTTDKIVSIHD